MVCGGLLDSQSYCLRSEFRDTYQSIGLRHLWRGALRPIEIVMGTGRVLTVLFLFVVVLEVFLMPRPKFRLGTEKPFGIGSEATKRFQSMRIISLHNSSTLIQFDFSSRIRSLHIHILNKDSSGSPKLSRWSSQHPSRFALPISVLGVITCLVLIDYRHCLQSQ